MRKLILLLLAIGLLLVMPSVAWSQRTTPAVSSVEGTVLHTMQTSWIIAETENSGDTQATALAKTERTKTLVDAAIAAGTSGDGNISTLIIPSSVNSARFRCIGITDNATLTHQIYLGTLGGESDCELVYVGQLAWVIGTQTSQYDQIAYTSGGTYEPKRGNIVTGNTSGETAVVVSKTLTSGAWADGDAAGTITYRSASGAFTGGGETVKITDRFGVTQSNVLTQGSDLIDFELADTVVVTSKVWGSSWSSVSPADDDTSAEAEIDLKGADYMVILTSACSADGKLLIKGY